MLSFLEIFSYATICISGSSYLTSTMYMFEAFGIGMKIREMSTSTGVNMSVRTMVVRIKEKYDQYWDNPDRINMLLMISRVLHPSYKLKFTNWLIDESFDGEGGELTCKLRDKVKSSLRSILKSIVVVEMRNLSSLNLGGEMSPAIGDLVNLQSMASLRPKQGH
ncbi:hypothetical protein JHK85_025630 [Glycine max]|nr:hypothetical protein JHK85_025630 [Glycine max]